MENNNNNKKNRMLITRPFAYNESLQHLTRLQFVWKTRKLRGEFKWSGSPRWEFSEKKGIPLEVLPFSRFYYLFGLLVPGLMSRESENFTGTGIL